MSECKHTRQEAAGYTFTTSAGIWQCPWCEIERLRGGLQLIANDKNRLMNEVARQTAASILGGKPIGEVAEWPTREEAEKRAAELMAIGLYNELLYAVASKYPGESRHDTALRYIRDRETRPSNGPSQAVEPKP